MGVGHLGGGLDLLGGRAAVLAELDVFGDRAAKEDGLLADDTDLLTEPADVEVLDVVPVELDRALGRVVESLEEADSGRLACLLKLEEKEKNNNNTIFLFWKTVPQPEGPTRASVSPAATEMVRPWRMGTSGRLG